MRSSVSQPSMPGMTTSSSTMSGRSSPRTRRQSCPSAAAATSISALLEAVRDHRPLRGTVVDEQHGDRAHAPARLDRDEPRLARVDHGRCVDRAREALAGLRAHAEHAQRLLVAPPGCVGLARLLVGAAERERGELEPGIEIEHAPERRDRRGGVAGLELGESRAGSGPRDSSGPPSARLRGRRLRHERAAPGAVCARRAA